MATTTLATIFDRWVSDIAAIVPVSHSEKKFERCPRHRYLRTWARDASSAFRRFEIRRTGPAEPATLTHSPTERQIIEEATITIAYPVNLKALYRSGSVPDDALDVDEIMRRDAGDIFDVVRSADNYVTGQHDADPKVQPPDEGDEHVHYQDLIVLVQYSEAMAL